MDLMGFNSQILSRTRWVFSSFIRISPAVSRTNTSVNNHFKIALDGLLLPVIFSDFVPMNLCTTDILNVNIGHRYEVVIEDTQTTANERARVGRPDSDLDQSTN